MRLPTKTVVTSSTMHEHHWLRHLIDCTLPQQAGQRFMGAGLYLTSADGAAHVYGSGGAARGGQAGAHVLNHQRQDFMRLG